MREFVLGGLLISPLVRYGIIAALLFIPIRYLLLAVNFNKWFWHPLLAEAALYVCILAVLNIAFD